MLSHKITPRFNDTDSLGHINNAVLGTWFEEARRPIFKLFIPNLDPKKWNLILARTEYDFIKELKYQSSYIVNTRIIELGNSSMKIQQEVLNDNVVMARGLAIMVHYDYEKGKSQSIPDEIRKKLEELK